MLSPCPTLRLEGAPGGDLRFLFERCAHTVIPAIEKPEQRYHAHQFDDLAIIPVRAHAPA